MSEIEILEHYRHPEDSFLQHIRYIVKWVERSRIGEIQLRRLFL
jgi:hypothetical protein